MKLLCTPICAKYVLRKLLWCELVLIKQRRFARVVPTPLLGIPAVSDTLRTDGGCQIWTKLGQGGQYITLRYPDMKKPS